MQVEPLIFASTDGRFRFTFVANQRGQVGGIVWCNLYVLEKVPWYLSTRLQKALLGSTSRLPQP